MLLLLGVVKNMQFYSVVFEAHKVIIKSGKVKDKDFSKRQRQN